jgi:hypothetical protein
VLALVGVGLLLQGAGDALARNGHQSTALACFLLGISLHFAACAWRLTGAGAGRNERIWVSVILGLGLFASYVMLQPLLLDSFDELDHMGTLFRILDSHTLFPNNTVLPVSPYYPGLELATAATKWMTGLPLVIDQLVVLAIIRLVLVLGVFLVVERVCRSSRAGGIGVLVYAASPQFYGFDAQYAYETIGLAFAVGAVYFIFFSVDTPRPRTGKVFALALGSVCAVVISHHVTGWLTVGFLVIWFAGMVLTTHPIRRHRLAGGWPFRQPGAAAERSEQPAAPVALLTEEKAFVAHRWAQTRVLGVATAVGILVGGAWTLYVFRLLTPYLGPIFSDAVTEIRVALGNGHGDRTLFKSSAGGGSPHWEVALILLAAAAWCLVLLPALYGVVFKRSVRGGGLRWIPALIAALYPLSVVANVSSGSKLVAERATTFIFFGMAVVLGAWLAKRVARARRLRERLATIVVATVIFLGSLLFGIGPLISLLPGPYQVGGDSLSYGSPSFAVAHWADMNLPAGSNVAADKDNGVLLNAIGGVNSVTAESGLVNPELLYFDHSLSLFDISLIRKADIRYLVVDDRLAKGLPLYGTYIADGEPPTRLRLPQLNKFNSYEFVKRIYDNGPIQVFDLTELLPASERAAPAGPPPGGSGLNVGIFVLAAVVGFLWLLRLRRRWSTASDGAHLALCGLVGVLVLGVLGAFLVRITHVSPEAVGLVVLVLLLALSVRPPTWQLRRPGDSPPEAADSEPPLSTPPPTPLVPVPSGIGEPGLDEHGATPGGNGDASGHPDTRSVPYGSPGATGGGGDQVVIGSTFYERREIRDVLAYLHVLSDPDDEASLRRILNVPKRGIGPKSVARLSVWATQHDVSLRVAVDRAEEAGFRTKALTGTAQLSALLRDLEPLVATTSPGHLVDQVVERSGYRTALVAERSAEANGRIDNLADMVVRADAFDDLDAFFEGVALDIASQGAEPAVAVAVAVAPDAVAPTLAATDEPEPETEPATPTHPERSQSPVDPASRRTRRRRVQIALGGVGIVLFIVGATAATAAEAKDWTPPAELSISTSSSDRSVAQVQLGSAGPIAARVEITNDGRTLWGKNLERTAALQDVALPSRDLHKGSRVRLVTHGHTLRWVDGWVSTVPKLKAGTSG